MTDKLGQTGNEKDFVLKSKIPMRQKLRNKTEVWPKKSVNLHSVLINHPSNRGNC